MGMITAELIRKQYEQYMAQKAVSKGEEISPEDILVALTQAEQKGEQIDGTEENVQ